MYIDRWVYNTLSKWARRMIAYMAKRKVTWGTIGLSFGIALILSMFGLTATSLEKMSPFIYNLCIFLGIIAVISFVLGYKLLNTGLDQDDIENERKLKETIKIAIREDRLEQNNTSVDVGKANEKIRKHLEELREGE